MALIPNIAQINAAAKGNNDLRETLLALHLGLTAQQAQNGSGPIKKVDATANKNLGPPGQCGLSVVGGNGIVTVTITLPQAGGGQSQPQNSTNASIYQELSASSVANFSSNVTIYPPNTSTSYTFTLPGQTLYWRLRSSYDQVTWNAFTVFSGPVSAGLQTSAATQPNLSLNQTNFATVDSIAAGGTATVRVYGSGGVGTSWTSVLGNGSVVIASGTILNVAYGTTGFVVWDGQKYQLKPQLAQVFPDTWIPVGKVSVIANGAGLVLPTFKAIVSGGAIVAIQILTAGNGMTSNPILTITDSTGTGATATCTESAGSATGVTVTNAGSGYSASPTVTPSGGVSGGVGGGGGPTGQNTGRFYGGTT